LKPNEGVEDEGSAVVEDDADEEGVKEYLFGVALNVGPLEKEKAVEEEEGGGTEVVEFINTERGNKVLVVLLPVVDVVGIEGDVPVNNKRGSEVVVFD
jgi:hypothetical protein